MSQNRKQRRAAAAAASAAPQTDADIDTNIPLSRPPKASESRRKQKGKTLIEIATERQKELAAAAAATTTTPRSFTAHADDNAAKKLFNLDAKETQFIQISRDGEVSQFTPDEHEETNNNNNNNKEEEEGKDEKDGQLIPPVIDTLLLSVPLTTLHFTLAFLAAHQYAQVTQFGQLASESILVAFPVLTLCIHFAHGHIIPLFRFSRRKNKKSPTNTRKTSSSSSSSSPPPQSVWDLIFGKPSRKTAFFLPLAVFLGGLLVKLTNEEGYYAVMKRAPSIGTMWVWCVLEMAPGAGVLAVLVPLGWGVGIMGYNII